MVQPRQRPWLRQPGRGAGLRHHRPHGDGAVGRDRRPAAARPAASADRGGQEGPDRRRASARLSWRALGLALLLPIAACQPLSSTAVTLERSPAGLEQIALSISSAGRQTHRFIVEVARTPEEQARGLMEPQSLAPDRGMLFPYATPQPVAFWMKNALIPLDMIF